MRMLLEAAGNNDSKNIIIEQYHPTLPKKFANKETFLSSLQYLFYCIFSLHVFIPRICNSSKFYFFVIINLISQYFL